MLSESQQELQVLETPAGSELSTKLQRWAGVLIGFSGLQVAVQLLSFAAGIEIVRALSKEAYAKYTLAGQSIAFAALVSDFGIAQAMLAIGGQFRQEPPRLKGLIRNGLRYRRMLLTIAAVGLLVALPLIFRARKWPSREVWPVALLCIATEWCLAGYAIRSAFLRVQQRFVLCQSYEAGAAGLRWLLVTLAAWHYSTVEAVLCANLLANAALYGAVASRVPVGKHDQDPQPYEQSDKSQLLKFCKPLIIPTMFYALQGQIAIWLLAFFGSAQYLANIGALSRLGQALVLFNACISSVAVPYFAGLKSRRLIIQRLLLYGAGVFGMAGALLLSGLVLPGAWLFVLGSKYAGLDYELILMLTSTGEGFVTGAFYMFSIARRQTELQWLTVPVSFLGIAIGVLVSHPTSTTGALIIDIVRQAPLLMLQVSLACRAAWKKIEPLPQSV